MPRAIVLHRADNVATLIDPGQEGESCRLQGEAQGAAVFSRKPSRGCAG